MDKDIEPKPYPYSGEWWFAQDEDALEYVMRGNMTGSPAHEGARRELDRRRADRRETVNRRIAWFSLIAAIIAAVASVIGLFMMA